MAGLFALNVSLKCPGAAANNPASSACNSNVLNAQRRIVSVLPRAHAAAVSGGDCTPPHLKGHAVATVPGPRRGGGGLRNAACCKNSSGDHGMPRNWRASLPATASYSVSAFKECAVQGMAALTHSESWSNLELELTTECRKTGGPLFQLRLHTQSLLSKNAQYRAWPH